MSPRVADLLVDLPYTSSRCHVVGYFSNGINGILDAPNRSEAKTASVQGCPEKMAATTAPSPLSRAAKGDPDQVNVLFDTGKQALANDSRPSRQMNRE
ncbi:hypothetical protein [Pararobbsia alpina]|uniref:hypothetical protein n=1 Tax=Pararobbsia alpina TaxID=621374 RepID=UPI0039A78056